MTLSSGMTKLFVDDLNDLLEEFKLFLAINVIMIDGY